MIKIAIQISKLGISVLPKFSLANLLKLVCTFSKIKLLFSFYGDYSTHYLELPFRLILLQPERYLIASCTFLTKLSSPNSFIYCENSGIIISESHTPCSNMLLYTIEQAPKTHLNISFLSGPSIIYKIYFQPQKYRNMISAQ